MAYFFVGMLKLGKVEILEFLRVWRFYRTIVREKSFKTKGSRICKTRQYFNLQQLINLATKLILSQYDLSEHGIPERRGITH
jgi:hypothetical protein